jgi:hypothetical protein
MSSLAGDAKGTLHGGEGGEGDAYAYMADDKEESLLSHDRGAGGISKGRMTFLFTRATMGPGCLSLPWAFSLVGYVLGPVVAVLVTAAIAYNIHLLTSLSDRLTARGVKAQSYDDVVSAAFGVHIQYSR